MEAGGRGLRGMGYTSGVHIWGQEGGHVTQACSRLHAEPLRRCQAGGGGMPRTIVPAGAIGLNEDWVAACWGDAQAHAVHHDVEVHVVLHNSRRAAMAAMWGGGGRGRGSCRQGCDRHACAGLTLRASGWGHRMAGGAATAEAPGTRGARRLVRRCHPTEQRLGGRGARTVMLMVPERPLAVPWGVRS